MITNMKFREFDAIDFILFTIVVGLASLIPEIDIGLFILGYGIGTLIVIIIEHIIEYRRHVKTNRRGKDKIHD